MNRRRPHQTSLRGGFRFLPLRGVGWLFLLLLLPACSPSRPKGILSERKMTDILVDYHLAQGMAESEAADQDVTRYKYIQAVFRKHGVTEAEFDSSMVYWSGRGNEFTHIYDGVVKRVQAQTERLGLVTSTSQDRFASLTSEGDTANIWSGKNFACIAANPVQCLWSFHMTADSTFRPGDSFVWRFRTQFVSQSMNNEAIAVMSFYYENDTVDCVTGLLRNSPKNELCHNPGQALDTLNLLSIAGFIYLPPAEGADQPKPLLVSDMMLVRMHRAISLPSSASAPGSSLAGMGADTTGVLSSSLPSGEGQEDEPEGQEGGDPQRLSPWQVRESQPKERKIHVTKENPNPIHPERGIPERTNRRRR